MSVYEAEKMALSGTATVETADGITYVNPGGPHGNGAGEAIDWTIKESGIATLLLTYDNPGQADRPVDLMINDKVLSHFTCPPKGKWSNSSPVQVMIPAGVNKIRTRFGPDGGPNIDAMTVQPVGQPVVPDPAQPIRIVPGAKPSATTTGIPAGTVLKDAPIGFRPDVGQTYRNLRFTGQFFPTLGGGVTTFINCLFDAQQNSRSVRTDKNAGTIILDHCELINAKDEAIYGPFWQAIGCYVHHHDADGFKPLHDCVIQGCYVTDLGRGANVHADGVQLIGNANVKVVGNFFDQARDVHNNRNLMASIAGLEHIDWIGNWHSGSGYFAIQLFDSTNPGTITFRDNTFTRFAANPKMYVPRHVQPGVVWANNKFEDGTAV